jgi:hypothetical protein
VPLSDLARILAIWFSLGRLAESGVVQIKAGIEKIFFGHYRYLRYNPTAKSFVLLQYTYIGEHAEQDTVNRTANIEGLQQNYVKLCCACCLHSSAPQSLGAGVAYRDRQCRPELLEITVAGFRGLVFFFANFESE